MASTSGLREGYTTGSCAAAAAKAAAMRVLGAPAPGSVQITTPEERIFTLPVVSFPDGSCGVVKDSGDDPDSTDGMMIKAAVTVSEKAGPVSFSAGQGVGTVTLPGLKVAPGEPAINPAPRAMIERAVREVIGDRGAGIVISAPEGEERAKRTFNPRLGITGGISILGTSGRVKPMDEPSLLASYTLEINTHAVQGAKALAIAFAGTGEQALRRAFGITGRGVVQCGNYPGFVIDECERLGIKKLLIGGHPGKLLKTAAGSFRTHNRDGGGALEALCTQAAIAGAPSELIKQIYACTTTEAAMPLIRSAGLDSVWTVLAKITAARCAARTFGEVECEAAYIENDGTLLGITENARSLARVIDKEA